MAVDQACLQWVDFTLLDFDLVVDRIDEAEKVGLEILQALLVADAELPVFLADNDISATQFCSQTGQASKGNTSPTASSSSAAAACDTTRLPKIATADETKNERRQMVKDNERMG
ncbi:MAG TPA: hypothetical protein VE890_06105 [Thermoguttaceae bacterium]|nr:hypothetical protein [Thermoguttaceae bacterium]